MYRLYNMLNIVRLSVGCLCKFKIKIKRIKKIKIEEVDLLSLGDFILF